MKPNDSRPARLSVLLSLLAAEAAFAQLPVTYSNLDDNASQWGVYIDPPSHVAYASIGNVAAPSVDGTALRLSLDPYPGAPARRRRLTPACTAT